METAFSRTITCDKSVTRELVLSLAALLRHLAAGECSCLESELGGGITLYRGSDAMRFETPEELSAAVPPLEPLDAFRMTFFCNPFPRPGEPFVSFFVGMDPSGSMQITASAASPVRAQELGLEIVSFLLEPGLSPAPLEPRNPQDTQHGDDCNQASHNKFTKSRKAVAIFAGIVGFIASVITIALAWPDILRFLSRLFQI